MAVVLTCRLAKGLCVAPRLHKAWHARLAAAPPRVGSGAAPLSTREGAATAAAGSSSAPLDAAPLTSLESLEDDLELGLDVEEAGAAAGALVLPRKLGLEAGEASATGAFQRLPMVAPSKELLDSAVRRAGRTPVNKKLKNEAQKAKNRCAAMRGAERWRAPPPRGPARRAGLALTPTPHPQGGEGAGHADEGAVRAAGGVHQGLPAPHPPAPL